jgi:hypothetical protein
MKKETLLINGIQSRISKNKSEGKDWNINKSNVNTIKIIDELLKYSDSDFKYPIGITISNPVTTVHLCSLDISRPSNEIGIIRAECGSNAILTYHSKGERKPFYGLIKSKENINKLLELKKRILAIIVA